ncbi:hypothetical protein L227DRAFT_514717, partial [Lentinus tigrinus ALCF2SS1-6]
FFQAFCMANNLKCMLAAKLLPTVLEQFTPHIDTAFTDNEVNSDDVPAAFSDDSEPVLEVNEKKLALLPKNLYMDLLRRMQADETIHHGTNYCSTYDDSSSQDRTVLNAMAESLMHVEHRGKCFSTATYREADSHVIYRTSSTTTKRLALGRVDRLFVHKRRCSDGQFHHQVFAVLRQYLELDEEDVKYDPYRRYPGLRASLIYDALSNDVEVIPMRDIIAHFVTCPYAAGDAISKSCMVALPLDQVCDISLSHRNIVMIH